MADKMTVKQALKAIQTEVNYHAGSDTHYRAEKLEQSLATLRAEIERLEKDAARYRWLRDREIPEWMDLWHQNPDRIDDAIDQAMKE